MYKCQYLRTEEKKTGVNQAKFIFIQFISNTNLTKNHHSPNNNNNCTNKINSMVRAVTYTRSEMRFNLHIKHLNTRTHHRNEIHTLLRANGIPEN